MKRLGMLLALCTLIMTGCEKHSSPPPSAPANLNISGTYNGSLTYTLVAPCPNNVCVVTVNFLLTVDQSGNEISGTYSDSSGAAGTMTGTVYTDTPTSESGNFTLQRYGYSGSFASFNYSVANGLLSVVLSTPGANPFTKHSTLAKSTSSTGVSIPGLGL